MHMHEMILINIETKPKPSNELRSYLNICEKPYVCQRKKSKIPKIEKKCMSVNGSICFALHTHCQTRTLQMISTE